MLLLCICNSVPTLTQYSCFSSSLTSKSPNYYSHYYYYNSKLTFKHKPHQTNTLTSFTCFSPMAAFNPSDGNVTQKGSGSVDPDCTQIIVVRHGETDWNAIGKMQGQLDVELNEVGRQQAVAVAERLSKEANISAIYSSDLKRALETAEMIAAKCGGLEVITDKDLRERHLGDLQGRLYHELARVTPKAHASFKSSRTDEEIPGGGESRDQLYQRCTSCLKRIGEAHRGESANLAFTWRNKAKSIASNDQASKGRQY
ncbi:phosphoglycerate mutase-like protein 4 isoform X2 [Silene latifolia]|uniref:phosphoglycerate mutase-like protein 4 isoform X2 n=1 Tax=Silene latifolia TaxID=37657 RepID=UPI003D784BDF